MLILEYISTHGTPSGALRECQPGRPRVPYRRMSNSVHHAQACIGSTRGQRDTLQPAEHSGDAAGTYCASDCRRTGPRDAAPSLISAYCNVRRGPIRRRHIPSVV